MRRGGVLGRDSQSLLTNLGDVGGTVICPAGSKFDLVDFTAIPQTL